MTLFSPPTDFLRYLPFVIYPSIINLLTLIWLKNIYIRGSFSIVSSVENNLRGLMIFLVSLCFLAEIIEDFPKKIETAILFELLYIATTMTSVLVAVLNARLISSDSWEVFSKGKCVFSTFSALNLLATIGGFVLELTIDFKGQLKPTPRNIILLIKALVLMISVFSVMDWCCFPERFKEKSSLTISLSQSSILTEEGIFFKVTSFGFNPEFAVAFTVHDGIEKVISSGRRSLSEFNSFFKQFYEITLIGDPTPLSFRSNSDETIQRIEERMDRIFEARGLFDLTLLDFIGVKNEQMKRRLSSPGSKETEMFSRVCLEVPSLFRKISWPEKEKVYRFYRVRLESERGEVKVNFEDKVENTSKEMTKPLRDLMRLIGSLPYFLGSWDKTNPSDLLPLFEDKLNIMLNESNYSLQKVEEFFDFEALKIPSPTRVQIAIEKAPENLRVSNWSKVQIKFKATNGSDSEEKTVTRSKEQILIFLEQCKLKKANLKLDSLGSTRLLSEVSVSLSLILQLIQQELNGISIADSTEACLFFELTDIISPSKPRRKRSD